jgi:GDPmannose 4,6-dehydratase
VEAAFRHVALDPADFVRSDERFLRPAEVDTLLADPTKAREGLGWVARMPFGELMATMVEADLEAWERRSGRRRGGAGAR